MATILEELQESASRPWSSLLLTLAFFVVVSLLCVYFMEYFGGILGFFFGIVGFISALCTLYGVVIIVIKADQAVEWE